MDTTFADLLNSVPTRTQRQAVMQLERLCRDERTCPNGMLPSERELSRLVGVSRPTLRAVLREMERLNVVRTMPNGARLLEIPLGADRPIPHTVAMLGGASPSALVHPEHRTRGWSYRIHLGVIHELESRGEHVLVINAERLAGTGPDALRQAGVSGILVEESAGNPADVQGFVRAARALGMPVVVHGYEAWTGSVDRVMSDHAAGAQALAEWLIARGRRRIARVWFGAADSGWRRMRDEGYERAMRAHGLAPLPPVRPQWPEPSAAGEPATREAFELAAAKKCAMLAPLLTGPDRPDALMLESDGLYFTTARACRMLHLAPGADVLIVGYDAYGADAREYAFEPTLPAATVDKHNDRIGMEMVRLLAARKAGGLPEAPQCSVVTPSLVAPDASGGGRRPLTAE